MSKHRGGEPDEPGRSGAGSAAASMVDWDLAVRLGAKVAGDGPQIGRDEATAVVAELRADAGTATGYVKEFTGLDAPPDTAPVLVVDRKGWIQANADAFATVIAPVIDGLTKKREPGPIAKSVGSKVTGAEVGGLLGFLSTKVLGQFDPFHEPSGRLLLVAPNVVHVERELRVDPADFRLWVCLHEETHRVQFTASPWLRDHLLGQMGDLASTMDLTSLLEDGIQRVADAIKGEGNLLEAVASPEQRAILDRVTGVMSLLEGHADVVMDGVGPAVIPTVATIRAKFNERRKGVGALDRILRRLMGLDAKMAQYRDGAKFVRHVVDKVGMTEFNAVFSGAEQLPSKVEIGDPEAWIKRVL